MTHERKEWLPDPQVSSDEVWSPATSVELCELEGAPVGPSLPALDERYAQPVSGNEAMLRRPLVPRL